MRPIITYLITCIFILIVAGVYLTMKQDIGEYRPLGRALDDRQIREPKSGAEGKAPLSSSALICVWAYNGVNPKQRKVIEDLAHKVFAEYRICVGTRRPERVAGWTLNNDRVEVIPIGDQETDMGAIRDKLVGDVWPEEHLIMMDVAPTDFLDWDFEEVRRALDDRDWAVLCGHRFRDGRESVHKDKEALRFEGWREGPETGMVPSVFRSQYLQDMESWMSGSDLFDKRSPWVPVSSCFGGLWIGRREFVQGCTYDGEDLPGQEHVHMNACVDGPIFVNPQLRSRV